MEVVEQWAYNLKMNKPSQWMNFDELTVLRSRLDVLEAQQAVMAGFISVLLQSELHNLPEPQQATLRAIYEALFEQTIARLLASEVGFSDATVRAIENLKTNMLGTASAG